MSDEKRSWIVTIACAVTKEVITNDCTESEARDNPFGNAESELEIDQHDWEVTKVKPAD